MNTVNTESCNVWGIHAPADNLFLEQNMIAIGWSNLGDLSKLVPVRDAFKEHYVKYYPHEKKRTIAICAGMLYRFVHEIKIGDYIVYPSKPDREIYIGRIIGDYSFNPNIIHANQRKVEWLRHFPRTAFSQGALTEIGAFLTLFRIKIYATEYLSALNVTDASKIVAPDTPETIAHTAEEIIETTKDFILKELSHRLKGYDMEDFVANLLQAMGYRTKVSPHGGDSGIDIIAYKDELPPRIIVQVKSNDGNITESTIQSLKGAMREGDYGLFITLSNYTKNAQHYLDNTPIIRGINGAELADLVLKYYAQLDEKYQKMIPLKMVYIPVSIAENE